MTTHEILVNWQLMEDVEVTSGIFYMDEIRKQDYTYITNNPSVVNPTNYGLLDAPVSFLGGASVNFFLGTAGLGPHVPHKSAPINDVITGRWQGSPEGRAYEYSNTMETEASAIFTQGTWTINDEYALTLGARHAEDKKAAVEMSSGYAELSLDSASNSSWSRKFGSILGNGSRREFISRFRTNNLVLNKFNEGKCNLYWASWSCS
jgi:hypothetical protein